jgi:hypothetical protein
MICEPRATPALEGPVDQERIRPAWSYCRLRGVLFRILFVLDLDCYGGVACMYMTVLPRGRLQPRITPLTDTVN